jgi:hypothetical protein
MSREFLTRMLDGKPMASVSIRALDGEFDYQFGDAN